MNNYVTIGTYTEVHEAHIARLRLDLAGVPCRLLDENVAVLRKATVYMIPLRLQVLQDDLELAVRALGHEFDAKLDEAELERQALEAGEENGCCA